MNEEGLDKADRKDEEVAGKVDSKDTNEKKSEGPVKHGIPWKIYISRALSAWGDRMWSYGAGLFMTALDESGSLRLVAIFGFVSCLSVIVFGPVMGNWIDRSKRLKAAQVFLSIQNSAVAVVCVFLALYFWKEDWLLDNWGRWTNTVIAVIVVVIGSVAILSSQGSKIVVERDWIVVIAANDDDRLATMNSVFRTIDLTCFILAPAALGVLFDFLGHAPCALFVAGWNLVSVVVEFSLLYVIYKEYKDLSIKPDMAEETRKTLAQKAKTAVASWSLYWRQMARNAGIGLSFLFLTVLGFDSVTTAFCLHQCVPASVLGAAMGISSLFGVMGSISFPFLRRMLNVQRTGFVGFFLLVIALIPCVVSPWLPGSPFVLYPNRNDTLPAFGSEEDCLVESSISVSVLLAGMIVFRFPLWVSDISVTQIMQQTVEVQNRGTVGGVQSGLNYGMDMVKFVLVMALPDDDTFGYLVLISFAAVFSGAVSYSSFAIKNWANLDGTKGDQGTTELAAAAVATSSSSPPASVKSYGSTDR